MSDLPVPLRLLPDTSEPEPEPVPEPAAEVARTSPGPLVTLQGGQMAWHDDVRAAISHGYAVARLRAKTLTKREGGVVNGLLNAKPESVAEQHQYAKSRAWVPAGKDGGLAEGMGVVFHAVIGRPGVAVGNAISGLHARQFRWCAAFLVVYVVALIAVALIAGAFAVVLMLVALALLTGLWAGAGALYVRFKFRPKFPPREESR